MDGLDIKLSLCAALARSSPPQRYPGDMSSPSVKRAEYQMRYYFTDRCTQQSVILGRSMLQYHDFIFWAKTFEDEPGAFVLNISDKDMLKTIEGK